MTELPNYDTLEKQLIFSKMNATGHKTENAANAIINMIWAFRDGAVDADELRNHTDSNIRYIKTLLDEFVNLRESYI